MDTAQVWAVIGVLAAGFFGMMTIVSTLFLRVIRAEIGGLRAEMRGRFEGIDGRFVGIDARFARVDEQFDGLGKRLDAMDRDIQFLMRREYDRGPE